MRYRDAMFVVSKHDKGDMFITVTCNPKWPEITKNLKPGQTAVNALSLTARILRMYVDAIVADIYKHGVLGKCVTKISISEFKKKGLPHCHLLIHFANQDKLHTTSDIDLLICAEIPDLVTQPLFYGTVKSTMMHESCGNINHDCPCMINCKCSKNYPKEFNNTTSLGKMPLILIIGEGMTSKSW